MGGSFDPAHEGHMHCARTAMKRLGLNQIWWLVAPQNPLKAKSAPLDQRAASARAIAVNPRFVVTTFEDAFGLAYTVDTICFLRTRSKGARFVWVMGADALSTFHRWRRWRTLLATIPVVIVPRPGAGPAMGKAFANMPAGRTSAGALLTSRPPAWTRLTGPTKPHASRIIRAQAAVGRTGESG